MGSGAPESPSGTYSRGATEPGPDRRVSVVDRGHRRPGRGVTVVVGPNGSGKTNLYRAMHLVHACAEGDLARAVVAEGGLASIVHAGWRKGEPRVALEVRLGDLCHDVTLATAGRGKLEGPVFPLDPVVTHEHVVLDTGATRVELLDRAGSTAFATDHQGGRVTMPGDAGRLGVRSLAARRCPPLPRARRGA